LMEVGLTEPLFVLLLREIVSPFVWAFVLIVLDVVFTRFLEFIGRNVVGENYDKN